MWGTQDLSSVLPAGGMGLLAQLRDAMSLTQNTRLLRLDTALPTGALILERCTWQEALHAPLPFHAELDCVSTDTRIPLAALMGTPATLHLQLSDGGWRQWHGHVTRAAHLGSDGGLTRYRLHLRDFTHWASLRRDTRIFQDQNTSDIVQTVLMAHPQARMRMDVASPGPLRAITTQYRETDWAFTQRLMASEGWSWRIDHDQISDDAQSASSLLAPARHTLVIFDAVATRPDLGTLRFSRPDMRGATSEGFAQDTLTALASSHHGGTNSVTLGAWDERRLAGVVGTSALPDAERPAGMPVLECYQGQGERQFADGRVADAQHGSLDVANTRAQAWLDALLLSQNMAAGEGAVRTMAVGATFKLGDHFSSCAFNPSCFNVLAVTHEAANNLSVKAAPLMSVSQVEAGSYRNQFDITPAHLRLVPMPLSKPTSPGLQTAVVMGQALEADVSIGAAHMHSDRDGRIRIQFPWQRGDAPLPGGMPAPSTPAGTTTGHAPGDQRSGTWVRVLQSLAGPDWGAVFTPRPGTEVLVDFLDGDIDRPVVVGQLHNGQHGLPWPAGEGSDANHLGTLSGWHHPLLDNHSGTQGANQWLIDDSQGQLRMRLLNYSASHGHSELSLGHLVQQGAQGGNAQRGQWLGEGFYGHTEGWAVVRAGEGLLMSTALRPAQGSSVASTQMDAKEAVEQLRACRQLGNTLSQSARQQGALGLSSHDDTQAWAAHTAAMDPATDGKLPATLNGQDARKAQSGSRTLQDPIEAFARPQLHLDTPGSAAFVSVEHLSLFSGMDTSVSTLGDAHLTSAHTLSAVSGQTTSLYTHAGGIQAITAQADLSLRAHTDAMQLWADQDIAIQSTEDEIRVYAKDSIVLTAGQSQIEIKGADITFTCPGSFTVKGAGHEWGGGGSESASMMVLPDARVGEPTNWIAIQHADADGVAMAGQIYKIHFEDGSVVSGALDTSGKARHEGVPKAASHVEYEPRKPEKDAPWQALDHLVKAAQQKLG
jgi:type VI secretion system secreted protein VgrG